MKEELGSGTKDRKKFERAAKTEKWNIIESKRCNETSRFERDKGTPS